MCVCWNSHFERYFTKSTDKFKLQRYIHKLYKVLNQSFLTVGTNLAIFTKDEI